MDTNRRRTLNQLIIDLKSHAKDSDILAMFNPAHHEFIRRYSVYSEESIDYHDGPLLFTIFLHYDDYSSDYEKIPIAQFTSLLDTFKYMAYNIDFVNDIRKQLYAYGILSTTETSPYSELNNNTYRENYFIHILNKLFASIKYNSRSERDIEYPYTIIKQSNHRNHTKYHYNFREIINNIRTILTRYSFIHSNMPYPTLILTNNFYEPFTRVFYISFEKRLPHIPLYSTFPDLSTVFSLKRRNHALGLFSFFQNKFDPESSSAVPNLPFNNIYVTGTGAGAGAGTGTGGGISRKKYKKIKKHIKTVRSRK